jgi:hypothetical protein
LQEFLGVNASLFENGAQGAFWDVARVVGDSGKPMGAWIVSDFVTACCVAIKLEPKCLEFLDDLAIPKAGQSPHLSAFDHQRIIEMVCHRWQGHTRLGFYEFSRYITSDLDDLGHCSPLRHQSLYIVGGGKINALRQSFDVKADNPFAFHDVV